MRLKAVLLDIAAMLVATGCGGATKLPGAADAASDAPQCTGSVGLCECNAPPPATHDVTAEQACALIAEGYAYNNGPICEALCGATYDCELPTAYGCVRETYGAVAGLVEAQTSRDASVRRAMRCIAYDECRHAELAWAVHAWVLPRLSRGERTRVESAMQRAIAELEALHPRGAGLVFEAVGSAAA